MDGHPAAMPAWNLGLRFVLELAAFTVPVAGAILGALVLLHLAFSMNRTRWLLTHD